MYFSERLQKGLLHKFFDLTTYLKDPQQQKNYISDFFDDLLAACKDRPEYERTVSAIRLGHPDKNKAQFDQTTCRLIFVAELASDLVKSSHTAILELILDEFRAYEINKLLRLLHGKKAHDGGNYSRNYTEYYFLQNAKFTCRTDGLISLVEIEKNSTYQSLYAEGMRNHGLLQDELEHLAKILGLEFDERSDFAKEIIFTSVCSKPLKAKELHLTEKAIKAQVYPNLLWRIFSNNKTTKGFSLFNFMPPELVINIAKMVPRVKTQSETDDIIIEGEAGSKSNLTI